MKKKKKEKQRVAELAEVEAQRATSAETRQHCGSRNTALATTLCTRASHTYRKAARLVVLATGECSAAHMEVGTREQGQDA